MSEKSVIFRDRHETTGFDLDNAQKWQSESVEHLVKDALTPERQIVGLAVTVKSASELEIAEGRLYDGPTGKIYALTLAQTASVFSMLPLQDKKWIAISAYGQEEDTDTQPRDYLLNLETGQTEPRLVPMERRRKVMTRIAQGLESPTPSKPEPSTGDTLLAHALLTPSGVQEVVLATSRRLVNVQQLNARVEAAEGWIRGAEPRIAHIMSDIAGLGQGLAARATIQQARQLGQDMARVKERLEIPDDYVFYGADHFLTDDETNPSAPGYSARLNEGLRPAIAAQDDMALALLNPIDPAAKVHSDTFVLPAYNEIPRLRMETYKGELTVNAYQYQSQSMIQRTMSRERIQYGEAMTYCTNSAFWANGNYDATAGVFRTFAGETWQVAPEDRQRAMYNHQFVRVTQFWNSTYLETYWDTITTNHTVNGSILAQTVLMAQTGMLTSIELYLTHKDNAAGLTLLVCDASMGQPNLDYVIAKLDVAANSLTTGWCKLTFARPVFVESGRRYAIVIVSGAAHRVGFTEGVEYTQGVLMYAQDNSYFSEAGDRDLMMRLNFAQFTTPRAVIQMQALQLVGGIGDIDMLYEGVTPHGTSLIWEYQVAGLWYPIAAGTAEHLASQPTLLPIRGVFVGTTDLMPGVRLDNSQIVVSRIGTAFNHTSTSRTLATASDEIIVRLLLEDFVPGTHLVDCDLIIAGSPVNHSSYHDEIVDERSRWREYKFNLGSTTLAYAIKIVGSTSNWRQAWHVAERYDMAL